MKILRYIWFPLACLFIALALCGRASPLNIERLSKQLSENNATWRIEVPVKHGTLTISRANPLLGFSGVISDAGGVSSGSPTNISVSVGYQVQSNQQPAKP